MRIVISFLLFLISIGIFAQDVKLPVYYTNASEIILQRQGYTVSYNQELRIPNWVFWHLTKERLEGGVKRPANAWHEDIDVPEPRANSDDYRGSGWSRGHMCPAGDNKWDADAMYESFLYTNICPQDAKLNSGDWNELELACRRWAEKFGDIYVVCGPILYNQVHKTIGEHKIVVPEAFFKVILCLRGNPKGIAFVCKNESGNKKISQYVNTIQQVERLTGICFFPNLSEKVAIKVKTKTDYNEWN